MKNILIYFVILFSLLRNIECLTIKYYNDSNCIILQKIETVKLNFCETIEEQGTLLSVVANVCNSTNVLGHVFDDSICKGNIFLNFSHTPKTCFYAGNIYYQYIDCEINPGIILSSDKSFHQIMCPNVYVFMLLFIFMLFM